MTLLIDLAFVGLLGIFTLSTAAFSGTEIKVLGPDPQGSLRYL